MTKKEQIVLEQEMAAYRLLRFINKLILDLPNTEYHLEQFTYQHLQEFEQIDQCAVLELQDGSKLTIKLEGSSNE